MSDPKPPRRHAAEISNLLHLLAAPRLAGGRDLRPRQRCKAGAVVGDRRRTTAEILRAATARTNSLASKQYGWEGLWREANTVQKIIIIINK